MKISARVQNGQGQHQVTLQTNDTLHSIVIAPRANGNGSSVNGGELLFLAVATCYCNDIYREAAKRDIVVRSVSVQVEGEFGAEGEPAKNVTYRAQVSAEASEQEILALMRETDRVTEIQNTLRMETPVELVEMQAVSI